MTFLIDLAYQYWPALYKKRFFKSLQSLQNPPFTCEPELLYLQQILTSNSTFIDIGTNKGIYLYQAEKIIKNGTIIGFEPNPEMVRFAQHLFPKLTIVPKAVSDNCGNMTLHIPKKGAKWQDTRATLEKIEGTAVQEVLIETTTLDAWYQQTNIKNIDVIKIDVEGHEWATIKGCTNVIQNVRPIFIIEIEKRHAQYPINAIFEWMEAQQYKVFYFDRTTLQLAPFSVHQIDNFQEEKDAQNNMKYINNFIFLPQS